MAAATPPGACRSRRLRPELHALVTEAPKTRIPRTLAEYREVAWLATRQPITVLPSVASLKALRQFAKTSRATKPYLGIGNPLLDGPQDHPSGVSTTRSRPRPPTASSNARGR